MSCSSNISVALVHGFTVGPDGRGETLGRQLGRRIDTELADTPRVTPLTCLVCTSHTPPMKVAVSVPDTVFQAAERVSHRMRVSRSRLYAKAVEAYVKLHSEEDITEQLNKVYAGNSSTIGPALEAASLEVLRRERWE